MGTNYYVEDQHIGKRSAAGDYCWDCGVTLCKGGNAKIHHDTDGKGNVEYNGWHNRCPICKQSITDEDLDHSSVGRELGFNKTPPAKKTGIKSCSSFTWAMHPSIWMKRVRQSKDKIVEDEYGRHFTVKEFCAVLEECPIQFEDSIDQEFS